MKKIKKNQGLNLHKSTLSNLQMDESTKNQVYGCHHNNIHSTVQDPCYWEPLTKTTYDANTEPIPCD